MFKDLLEQSGLKSGEAAVYDLLLQYGDSPASEIHKKTNYKRGIVYKYLEDLKNKGYISSYKKNKKTYFRAENPNKLLDDIEKTLKEVSSQKKSLEAVLPSLETQFRVQGARPAVTYYEGISGIKRVFEDIYAPKDEPVYGAVDLEKADKALPGHIIEKLIPLRIKNKVKALTFLADSENSRKVKTKDEESLRETLLLDKEKYPLPAEIDVYEDKVALMSFDKEEFVGVLIQNKDIATTLKSILKLAFEKSKPKD